jgi:hypothetical protein
MKGKAKKRICCQQMIMHGRPTVENNLHHQKQRRLMTYRVSNLAHLAVDAHVGAEANVGVCVTHVQSRVHRSLGFHPLANRSTDLVYDLTCQTGDAEQVEILILLVVVVLLPLHQERLVQ